MPPVNTRLDIQFVGRNETAFTSRVKARPSLPGSNIAQEKGPGGRFPLVLLISLERSYLNKTAFNKSTKHLFNVISALCL